MPKVKESISRVYQPTALAISSTIRLAEKASHHLAHVLRAKVGDYVTLFNGTGGEYQASIIKIDKKGVEVKLITFLQREAESPRRIYLAQGLPRGDKMDFIVQKAVELGVHQIIPLLTERCHVRLDSKRKEKRLHHWQSIAASACEQCGRNRIPEITLPMTFANWLPAAKSDQCLGLVLSPHVKNKLPSQMLLPDDSIMLLIGPEGGLSEDEIKAAITYQFVPLNLGPRILRTETAPLAALAILQHYYGDL